jgi:hypothetical protein
VNFWSTHHLLYTAGMCDVTFTGIYNTIYTAYVFFSGCTTMWVASRHNRQRGLFVSCDSHVPACSCYSKQFTMLTQTSDLLQKSSVLLVCFFNERMRQLVCLTLLGQWFECFTSHQLRWDANGLGLPLDVQLAVTFSSCEWIINSRTRTSRTFLWTILSPHDYV